VAVTYVRTYVPLLRLQLLSVWCWWHPVSRRTEDSLIEERNGMESCGKWDGMKWDRRMRSRRRRERRRNTERKEMRV
jgi:hypothetical protein